MQIWQWNVPTSKSQTSKTQDNSLQPTFPGFKEEAKTGKIPVIPLSAAPLSNFSGTWGNQTNEGNKTIEAAAKSSKAKPRLLGLLHNLPSNVTTVSACMAAVAAGSGSGSQAGSPHLTGLVAAATVGGSIELVSLSCGSLLPLAAQISISLGKAGPSKMSILWAFKIPVKLDIA